MSSTREERIQQARQLDEGSTVLINFGVKFVKKNPIPVGLYLIGILLCLLFNGYQVSESQRTAYEKSLQTIDYNSLYDAQDNYYDLKNKYDRSKGWFSCDSRCQLNKRFAEEAHIGYQNELAKEKQLIKEAKSSVGLFSAYGVTETRDLFWNRFAQGRGFAQRQSKWDALFLGIRAMSRDESLFEYLARLLMNLLMNFTIGTIGAVIAFIWSLYSLIQTYQASILYALPFFMFASLSAVAFAMTWLIGLYAAAAGTVYVGAKIAASNLRVQDGRGEGPRGRVRYE